MRSFPNFRYCAALQSCAGLDVVVDIGLGLKPVPVDSLGDILSDRQRSVLVEDWIWKDMSGCTLLHVLDRDGLDISRIGRCATGKWGNGVWPICAILRFEFLLRWVI